jgi:hypothetical protein
MSDDLIPNREAAVSPPPEEIKLTNGGDGEPVPAAKSNKSVSGGAKVVPISKPAIVKPEDGLLDRFKSKRPSTIANVETAPGQLPHYPIPDARDFVRLHPDDEYWSDELCFVRVPIKGQKKDLLHLIDEEVALQFLSAKKIIRHRLALATKPHDVFFLAHVPSQNLDNSWNVSVLSGCEQAKRVWVQLSSRKEEGVESYKIDYARDPDAFPKPRWLRQSLGVLIVRAFHGCAIDNAEHPALLRLIGARQSIS